MRFQIDNTKSNVRITVTHTDEAKELRLTLKRRDRKKIAFRDTLTRSEARALAGGILALLDHQHVS